MKMRIVGLLTLLLVAAATWAQTTGSANADAAGDVVVKQLNNIRFASQYPGADIGAKINAAIADLPAEGGTVLVDVQGSNSFSTPITITKPLRMTGLGRHATVLNYTGTAGAAVTINVPWSTDQTNVWLSSFSVVGPGSAVGTTTGILVSDGVGYRLEDLYVEGFSADGIAVTGTTGSKTNTNMGSADGVFVRSSTTGIRWEGDNVNVQHYQNMDVRGCATGVYLKNARGYPGENSFQGHVSYNTTNIKVESMFNRFDVYLEPWRSTTYSVYLTETSGYNSILVANSWDATTVRDLGTFNTFRRPQSSFLAFPDDPARGNSYGSTLTVYPSATSGPNPTGTAGIAGTTQLRSTNTQDWTGAIGLNGVLGQFISQSGAAGTVANVALFRGYVDHTSGTVRDLYGVYIPAPRGTGTIVRKRSFYGEVGAGLAEFGDGIAVGAGNSPTWTSGTGEKTGRCSPAGSLFTRTDGGPGSTLYVCEGGIWAAK
jgi:hypothetical protein